MLMKRRSLESAGGCGACFRLETRVDVRKGMMTVRDVGRMPLLWQKTSLLPGNFTTWTSSGTERCLLLHVYMPGKRVVSEYLQ